MIKKNHILDILNIILWDLGWYSISLSSKWSPCWGIMWGLAGYVCVQFLAGPHWPQTGKSRELNWYSLLAGGWGGCLATPGLCWHLTWQSGAWTLPCLTSEWGISSASPLSSAGEGEVGGWPTLSFCCHVRRGISDSFWVQLTPGEERRKEECSVNLLHSASFSLVAGEGVVVQFLTSPF